MRLEADVLVRKPLELVLEGLEELELELAEPEEQPLELELQLALERPLAQVRRPLLGLKSEQVNVGSFR